MHENIKSHQKILFLITAEKIHQKFCVGGQRWPHSISRVKFFHCRPLLPWQQILGQNWL